MHELSIAVALVDLACEQSARMGAVSVCAVHVRIGPLAGVVEDALRFSFDLAAEGTPIAGARLAIERVPLTAWCPHCGEEREVASVQHLRCPVCDRATPDVRRGRDLQLFGLEITDADTAHC